ncbi:hypothetical protein Ple7327_1812 [Pleurocapsa sp. PCC 7327]|nr:hypothetical protein Ple7327_1812 [Pleurocapsa sp. PCC 7327]
MVQDVRESRDLAFLGIQLHKEDIRHTEEIRQSSQFAIKKGYKSPPIAIANWRELPQSGSISSQILQIIFL